MSSKSNRCQRSSSCSPNKKLKAKQSVRFLSDRPITAYPPCSDAKKTYRFGYEILDKVENGLHARSEWSAVTKPVRKRKWITFDGTGKGGLLDAFLVDSGESSPTCFWIELPVDERVAHVIKHHEEVHVGKNGHPCLVESCSGKVSPKSMAGNNTKPAELPSLSWEEEVSRYEEVSSVLSPRPKEHQQRDALEGSNVTLSSQSCFYKDHKSSVATEKSISFSSTTFSSKYMKAELDEKLPIMRPKTSSDCVRRIVKLSHSARNAPNSAPLLVKKSYSLSAPGQYTRHLTNESLSNQDIQRGLPVLKSNIITVPMSVARSKMPLERVTCKGVAAVTSNYKNRHNLKHPILESTQVLQHKLPKAEKQRCSLHAPIAEVFDFSNKKSTLQMFGRKAIENGNLVHWRESLKQSIKGEISLIEECIRDVALTEKMITASAFD